MTAQQRDTRWWGFAALAAGLAMIVLDGTIVGVALPAMVDDLGMALDQAQWVTTSYAVILAALLLTSGRLGDRLGRRRLFVAGVVLFAVASFAAAGAMQPHEVIAARLVQGVAGAMVLPSTVSSLNAVFRGRDRSMAFGLWGAVMAAAAAIGPLLGGWLTTALSWRWVFLVNLPVAAVIIPLALRFLPETSSDETDGSFDYPGLLTSACGLGLFVFGLVEGPALGWVFPRQDMMLFGQTLMLPGPFSPVLPALVIGGCALIAFVLIERSRSQHGRTVLLDLSLFRLAAFSWGAVTATVVSAGEFALLFVLPLFLVFALQLTVMQAGLVLAAMAFGAFVSGAAARSVASRLGPPRVVTIGLVLELLSAVTAAVVVAAAAPLWTLTAVLAGYGLGLGLASAQLTSTVLRDVPVEQSGAAAGAQSTVRQVGAALGGAVSGTVLALSFAVTVPAQLAAFASISADDRQTMVDYMTGTAGSVIAMIRDRGADGYFGALGPQVADALTVAFRQSASAAVWVAAGFLALGVVGAVVVEKAAGTRTLSAEESAPVALTPG